MVIPIMDNNELQEPQYVAKYLTSRMLLLLVYELEHGYVVMDAKMPLPDKMTDEIWRNTRAYANVKDAERDFQSRIPVRKL